VLLPDPTIDLTQPFLRSSALAAGVAPSVLRRSSYRRLFRGVYVAESTQVTPGVRARAALLLVDPGGFASHASAARVYGVPLPVLPDEHISVTDPALRRPRPGVRCHVCREPDTRVVGGVRVSAPAQLFVELASMLSLVDLVVVGDELVRRGLTTTSELVDHCGRATGSGSLARRAADLVRERVDSPMETRLRLLLVLAGLPEPEVNLTLRDVDGVPLRRYDLIYRQARTIVEYDGRQHTERVENWEDDLLRREAIDNDQWRILVVTSRGIYVDPARTIERVWRVLRSRQLPGVPTRPSDDWRRHFPGRG
jgi:hypothetical protein